MVYDKGRGKFRRYRRNKMKNMYWFTVGFCAAILSAIMISCTISPLEASASEPGSTPYNPLYVKIVD